ncbi:MAG: hypothetical protein V4660_12920 [Pseudomonadota bacterium]
MLQNVINKNLTLGRQKWGALLCIFMGHVFVIFSLLEVGPSEWIHKESAITFINLPNNIKKEVTPIFNVDINIGVQPIMPDSGNFVIESDAPDSLEPAASSARIKNEISPETIFDPRVRKRLQENSVTTRQSSGEGQFRYDSSGNSMYETGNGNCMRANKKLDSQERGTTWSFVSCGKNDSEKMMDNIQRELDSKKGKLKMDLN